MCNVYVQLQLQNHFKKLHYDVEVLFFKTLVLNCINFMLCDRFHERKASWN